jgi:F-type H+-transporting ATPase subunit b
MEGNPISIILTIFNFIISLLFLKYFFFEKIMKVIDDRNNEVMDTINKANADKKEAEVLKIQTQKNLDESKQQGKNIVEDYKQKAEKVSENIKSEASSEAELIITRAKKDIEREKEKAEDELKKKVVDLAVILSAKALEKSIDEAEHRRLIEEFIAKVGN